MKPMLEKEFERKFVALAKSAGCLTYKFTSPAHAGVPDRIVIGPHGTTAYFELKREGNKPTALQARELRKLSERGVFACYTDDLSQAVKHLQNFLAFDRARAL